jgi:hypothetical protein
MRRLFAALLALTCVIGSTPSFALVGAGHGHGSGRGAFLGAPAPEMPTFKTRIPAPLPPPAQAPVINGPLSEPRGM